MAGFTNWVIVATLFAIGILTAPFLSFPVPISSATLSSSSSAAHFILKDEPQVKQAYETANKAAGKTLERVKTLRSLSMKFQGGDPAATSKSVPEAAVAGGDQNPSTPTTRK